MSKFIMPLNITVTHIMIITDLGETTCRKYHNEIIAINQLQKHHLVIPEYVCKYLNISYEHAYKRLKDYFDRNRGNEDE